MRRSNIFKSIISLITLIVFVFAAGGCTISGGTSTESSSDDLMNGIEAKTVPDRPADERFITAQTDLALKLFRSSAQISEDENVLLSPLSILLALAMTANGADGQTRAEMETLLGNEIPLEELNEYIHSYLSKMPSSDSCRFNSANSIWFRDDQSFRVKEDFLRRNADYYGAQIFKDPFSGDSVSRINNWVRENTDDMIDQIIDRIDPETVMFLINALSFDAEWDHVYQKEDVVPGSFVSQTGEEQDVQMMYSTEWKYIEDENAIGFIKDYKGGKYSFAALLPTEEFWAKEGSIDSYIETLSSEKLYDTLQNPEQKMIIAGLPKFESEYETTLSGVLSSLGMPTAFDPNSADFSGIGSSDLGPLYINEVLHKTFISVDELGTRAGAVTAVIMEAGSAMIDPVEIILDRPFVYMILDNETGLPIFLGCVNNIA